MDSLIKYGHVTRGYLGVMIQDVTPALAKEFKLKDSTGALIGDVVPKGPADKAGFKNGDVVLEFNGKKVPDSRRLRLAVGETKPGTDRAGEDPARWRDQDPRSHRAATARQRTARQEQRPRRAPTTAPSTASRVSDLDQQTRQELKVPDNVKGVVITEVQPDSPAAEAGLKQGDVIQEINRHPVKTADEAVKLTENTKDKVTLLRIWSNGGSHYVVVDESKAG